MKTSIYGKGLFALKTKIYLRMFALFSAVILLTACGSASVGDKVVENTGEAEATPTLPPGRGPSAVFPASYAPWEPTPTPTPAPPTPTPVPETEWTQVKEMLTYKFEPYIESPQKTESDFSSRQEYESFIKDYCEKKYNENMAYVQNTDIDTLYVRLEDSRCGPNEFEEKVFLAIKNKDTISAWKQAIASMRPQKRANYMHKRVEHLTVLTDIFSPDTAADGLEICPILPSPSFLSRQKSVPLKLRAPKTDYFCRDSLRTT